MLHRGQGRSYESKMAGGMSSEAGVPLLHRATSGPGSVQVGMHPEQGLAGMLVRGEIWLGRKQI